jgi:pyrroline-5-carboxylate reductase
MFHITCDFVFALVYSGGSKATSEDLTMVGNILSVAGISEMVPESLINAAGAVAGSGPAFVSTNETASCQKEMGLQGCKPTSCHCNYCEFNIIY